VTEAQTLQIRDAEGMVVWEKVVAPVEGELEAGVDLGPWAPGVFEVRLGGVVHERVYAEAGLAAGAPVAILELVLRPQGVGGFPILDAAGSPVAGGRLVRLSFQARATFWRYVVVPRSDPDLEADDLRLEHAPDSGPAFAFSQVGAGTVPPGDLEAVWFESTTPIALRAQPYRGLALHARPVPEGGFVPVLTDLPNPRPEVLSPASTPARPVSEVFVYL
jgi:hypothetical protein